MGFEPSFTAVLVCIFASTITKAAVQFNFSASEVQISERGDLPSQLSIVKTGEHQGNISIRVMVIPITENNNDYIANDDHTYVFTSDTRELPIQTRLRRDMSGEDIESFIIRILPPVGVSSSVEIVFPSNVTVIIIDDDTVVIGFTDSNMPVTVVEGSPGQRVYIDVKQEGLRLDPGPTDMVQIGIKICSGNGVQIERSNLQFTGESIRQFTTILAIDNNLSDGTRLAQLCISVIGMENNVPAKVYPSSIQVEVIDNDVIQFQLNINNSVNEQNPQQPTSVTVSEGDSPENLITVNRSGLSNFTYNVTLRVESLINLSDDALDLILRTEYTFQSSTNEMDILSVPLQLRDDNIPEKKKLYRISIKNIKAFEFSPYNNTLVRTDALTSIEGEPITITVYDNEFNIGFVNDTVLVPEGFHKPLCVSVFDFEPSDIDPRLKITLQIAAHNETSVDKGSDVSQGYLTVNNNGIMLNSVNPMECFHVEFHMDNHKCDVTPRKFIIQLTWIPDPDYTVNFHRQNITVSIDDDCALQMVSITLTVGLTIFFVPLAVTLISIPLVVALLVYKHHKAKRRYYTKENPGQ